MAQLPPLVRSYQALQESDLAESAIPQQIADGEFLSPSLSLQFHARSLVLPHRTQACGRINGNS